MVEVNTGSTWVRAKSFQQKAISILWAVMLISVPVTSFPPVGHFLAYTPVSPLILLPLIGLGILHAPSFLNKQKKIPRQFLPWNWFVLAALLSSALAFFLPLLPTKGQTVATREIRAFVTLFIGLLTYLLASDLPNNSERLKASLRYISIGGIAVLIWSTVQAFIVLDGQPGVPFTIDEIHRKLVFRGMFSDRVTGLAFEPSWFGDQLVILYIPLWLSSLLNQFTPFEKLRKPYLEGALVVWGILVLILTKSRISLLSLLLQFCVVFLGAIWFFSDRIFAKRSSGTFSFLRSRGFRASIMTLALPLLGLALYSVGLLMTKFDSRLERLYVLPSQMEEIRAENPYEVEFDIANRLAFAERVVYWSAGFRVFEQFPILGVGLGNSGFLIEENLPAFGFRLQEIQEAVDDSNRNFLNPKNLWIRLLAETGVVGFTIYVAWLIVIGVTTVQLRRGTSRLRQVIGLMGALALTAVIFEGFSVDSFALPQLWITFGLVTAAYRMDKQTGETLKIQVSRGEGDRGSAGEGAQTQLEGLR